MAVREGFEPPTLALGKLCSILLSYRTVPPLIASRPPRAKQLRNCVAAFSGPR